MGKVATQKKKPNKKFAVGVGDIVQFHTYNPHATGPMGTVTHVLNDKSVVVKSMAPYDLDYSGQSWVVLTSEPTGTTQGGNDKSYYSLYIERVLFRAAALPTPKTVKPAKEPKVIKDQDALIKHLESGDTRAKIIILPEAIDSDQSSAV